MQMMTLTGVIFFYGSDKQVKLCRQILVATVTEMEWLILPISICGINCMHAPLNP